MLGICDIVDTAIIQTDVTDLDCYQQLHWREKTSEHVITQTHYLMEQCSDCAHACQVASLGVSTTYCLLQAGVALRAFIHKCATIKLETLPCPAELLPAACPLRLAT